MIEHGDCFELVKTIPAGSVDFVCTDPPYGRTAAPWDVAPDYEKLFPELWRVLKPNGAIVVTSTLPEAVRVIESAKRFFRYDLIWEKSSSAGFLNAKKMPLRTHELILVFYRKLPTYNPQFRKGEPRRMGMSKHGSELYGTEKSFPYENPEGKYYPRSVVKFAHDKDRYATNAHRFHSTQKPQGLLRWLIRTYTNAGETVFDPFMGSGSTGVAAAAEGREFIGFEKDEGIFNTARDRRRSVQGQISPGQKKGNQK